ncbi:helix-turn-helix domain-containing protein [Thermus sp. 93170]|uniref:helix-turn-helix domain-containing protein n=1 Tax=Thermus sp. 93170 TaxID=1046939 RepID=UPI003F43BCF1
MVRLQKVEELETPLGTRLPVAWLELGGRTEVAVPMARLGEVLGYERKNLYGLVDRDPVLSNYRVVLMTTRDGVPHKTAFLQRPGVLGVLAKMDTSRIQDPAKRERVIAFQRWAFETLDRLLFEGQAPAQPPLFHPAPAVPAPAAPSHAFKGNRELAVRMLTGEVLSPRGELLSYKEIARRTGVPSSTLHRMAHRLGVAHLRSAKRLPPVQPTPDLARLLAQQAQLLLEAARLLATPPPSGVR